MGFRNSSRSISPGCIGGSVATIFICRASSVIVHDLNIGRSVVRPTEADAPLIIDPDRVLALPIPLQGFKPIGGRNPKITKPFSCIDCLELATGNLEYLNWEALWALAVEHRLRNLVPEAPDQRPGPRHIERHSIFHRY